MCFVDLVLGRVVTGDVTEYKAGDVAVTVGGQGEEGGSSEPLVGGGGRKDDKEQEK